MLRRVLSKSLQLNRFYFSGFNRFNRPKKPQNESKQQKPVEKQQPLQPQIESDQPSTIQNQKLFQPRKRTTNPNEPPNKVETQTGQKKQQVDVKTATDKKTQDKQSTNFKQFNIGKFKSKLDELRNESQKQQQKPEEEQKKQNQQKQKQKQTQQPESEQLFSKLTKQFQQMFEKQKNEQNSKSQTPKGENITDKRWQLAKWGGLAVVLWFLWNKDNISGLLSKEIPYNQLLQKVEKGQIASISLTKNKTHRVSSAMIISQDGKKFKTYVDDPSTMLAAVNGYNNNSQHKVLLRVLEPQEQGESFVKAILTIACYIWMFSIFRSVISKSPKGMNNDETVDRLFGSVFGKNKMVRQNVNVKFSNVAGMDAAKKEITEFVDFLRNPERFSKLGARIPRGALLSGPPGTGKTLLAKACAGEANVAFFSLSGSDFVEMYVGVGASRVRNLFKEARAAAPSIIFIDEIDAVGRKRSQGQFTNEQKDSTLNQMLVQMDGFNTKQNVVVFAATNRKELLDPALTRPGRFDRTIEVDLPDLEGRRQIFQVHLAPLKLNKADMTLEQYARRMATLTPGFSGADIANLCNEAAIMAARKDKKEVDQMDFELASDRVIAGTEKKSLMSDEQRKLVAYHQSGHGVVSWFLEGAKPLLKLTIVPRSKGSLGFAQYLPDDKQIHTKQDLFDQLCVIIAGRLAEQEFFGYVTTGAQDDLNKITTLANQLIKKFGMSSKLGNMSFTQSEYIKEYSEAYSKKIDLEVQQLIKTAETKARQIVKQKKELIKRLAEVLLQKQTIDYRTIRQVLGERPFEMNNTFRDYISNV